MELAQGVVIPWSKWLFPEYCLTIRLLNRLEDFRECSCFPWTSSEEFPCLKSRGRIHAFFHPQPELQPNGYFLV
jgi:hypothetical protein